jgi:heterotetrameric sarcosine oxidase gamma subunit
MPDRSRFWSPVPVWPQTVIQHRDLSIAAVSLPAVWMVSGDLAKFLTQRGGLPCWGPRELCDAVTYALRLAPDRLLFVSDDEGALAHSAFGWSDGMATTDVGDGFVLFDITGRAALELMQHGANYAFEGAPAGSAESAIMQFAGLKVAVARLRGGWRLHVERPYATALWQWLQHAASEWDKPPART